jgi:tetratricopeptide (TPR) repeat protein
MRKIKEIIGSLYRVVTNTVIVCVAFLMVYLYVPLGRRILAVVLTDYSNNKPKGHVPFSSVDQVFHFYDVFAVFKDLLAVVLIIVVPSGLTIKRVGHDKGRIHRPETALKARFFERPVAAKARKIRSNFGAVSVKEWSEIGKSLYTSGHYKEAIEAYTHAFDLSNNENALFNRAAAYYQLGDKKKSLLEFKAAARLGNKKSREVLNRNGAAW